MKVNSQGKSGGKASSSYSDRGGGSGGGGAVGHSSSSRSKTVGSAMSTTTSTSTTSAATRVLQSSSSSRQGGSNYGAGATGGSDSSSSTSYNGGSATMGINTLGGKNNSNSIRKSNPISSKSQSSYSGERIQRNIQSDLDENDPEGLIDLVFHVGKDKLIENMELKQEYFEEKGLLVVGDDMKKLKGKNFNEP